MSTGIHGLFCMLRKRPRLHRLKCQILLHLLLILSAKPADLGRHVNVTPGRCSCIAERLGPVTWLAQRNFIAQCVLAAEHEGCGMVYVVISSLQDRSTWAF